MPINTAGILKKSSERHCDHLWKKFFYGPDFSLDKCSRCFLIKTVSKKKTLAQYSETDIEEAVKQYWMRGDEWREFSRKFVDYLPSKKGRLLDVGCGLGWIVAQANKQGYKACGVDPSRGKVALGKKRVEPNLTASSFESFNPRQKFDYITLNHVLEHIENLPGFLQKIKTLLSKNGKVLVACPNINSLTFRIFKNRWYPMSPKEHYWQFTPLTLARVLKDEGFSIKKLTINSMSYNPPNIFKKAAFFLLTTLSDRLGLGDQVVILAQKND